MKSKKLLAMLVALAMCLPMVLTACDKLSKKDIEADPIGRITQSVCDTTESITKSLSPLEPLRAAEKKGSFEFGFAPADLGMTLGVKGAYDAEAKKMSGDVSIGNGESDVTVKLNVEDDKAAFAVPGLFEGAYGVELSTLMEDMKESQLLELLGVDSEEIMGQLQTMIDSAKNPADASALSGECKKLGDDLKARLNKCVSGIEKKDVTIGGAETKAFEVVFRLEKGVVMDILTILKNDIKPIIEAYIKLVPESANYGFADTDVLFSEIDEAFDGLIEEISKEGNDATAEVTAYLNSKTADFMSLKYVLTAVDGENKDSVRVEGDVELGAESAKPGKLTGTLKTTQKTTDDDKDLQTCDAKFVLECIEDDKTFSVKLSADSTSRDTYSSEADEGSLDEEIHNTVIEFNNDKSAKTYVLKLESNDAYNADNALANRAEKNSFEISGKMEYDATNLTLTVDKVVSEDSVGEDFETLRDPERTEIDGIGLTFKLSADAGEIAMPEYKNIWKLTQGEVLDLMLEVQQNLEEFSALIEDLGKKLESTPLLGFGFEPDTDIGETYFDVCDNFNDSFDYNSDGKVDEADYAEWEASCKPYGSVFDETFDYNQDGEVGTDDDRAAYDMTVEMFKNMPLENDDPFPPLGEGEKSFFDICDKFDESFDYNSDGKVDDADHAIWEELCKPFGSTFDENFDYDEDGKCGTADDRDAYDMMVAMYKSLPIDGVQFEINNGDDEDGDDTTSAAGEKTYFDICDSFDESFDYNFDGKLDDADRAEWEAEYKPYGSVFDETYDYDGDGECGTDDDRAGYKLMLSMSKGISVNDMFE